MNDNNMINRLKTYVDQDYLTQAFDVNDQWLGDAIYKEIIKKTVVTCVDVVVTVRGVSDVIYLAKRVVYPMKGLWFLGGRVQFNSLDMENAISDNVFRETKYRLSSERFNFLVVNDYKFTRGAQGDFPVRSFAATFQIKIDENELMQLSAGLIKTEYESNFGLQPFTRRELVKENAHEVVIDAFDIIWN